MGDIYIGLPDGQHQPVKEPKWTYLWGGSRYQLGAELPPIVIGFRPFVRFDFLFDHWLWMMERKYGKDVKRG
jgi:hypothetical protein